MKKVLVFLFMVIMFASCDTSEDALKEDCSTPATVRDLTGLDGCGFVFELADGTRLEPLRFIRCGTTDSLTRVEDPLLNFEFVEGKIVSINYEIVEPVSICMVGPIVRITCLTEVVRSISEE